MAPLPPPWLRLCPELDPAIIRRQQQFVLKQYRSMHSTSIDPITPWFTASSK